ncbi:MAG TPA: PASTA domain-containing protein, partial [Gemmatimonadaceae bacterium]
PKFARRDGQRSERAGPDSYDPNGNVASREMSEETSSYVVELAATPKPATIGISPRPIPDVRGLSVREAVRALHTAGFRVRLLSVAAPGTLPVAGTIAPPGTLVQLSRPVE